MTDKKFNKEIIYLINDSKLKIVTDKKNPNSAKGYINWLEVYKLCESLIQSKQQEKIERVKKLPDLTTTEFGEDTVSRLDVLKIMEEE